MFLNYEKDKFRFAQASGREETMSTIRDISLAPLGHKRIEWVKDFMPVLSASSLSAGCGFRYAFTLRQRPHILRSYCATAVQQFP